MDEDTTTQATLATAVAMPAGPYGAVLHDGEWHIAFSRGDGTSSTVAKVESSNLVTMGQHIRGEAARELTELLNLGRAAAHAGWRP